MLVACGRSEVVGRKGDFASLPVTGRPTLRVNSAHSPRGSGGVSACCLDPELVAFLARSTRPGVLLKSIFRVTVAQDPLPDGDSFPDVSGRYILLEDQVQFIPHFPFEAGVKYRATFDPGLLSVPRATDSLILDFSIPAERNASALTEVTHVFPSCDLLPENLLRFHVCFSNSMRRGRALEEITLLDSDGQPVADALYRPPVELWDRTMRHLTVLLDPGRLKRWVGPNVELGPPLKVGQQYTLEGGSGIIDLYGRPLRAGFRKHFVVGNAIRERISVERWEILLPATRSRKPLVLKFTNPLDWALLLQTITIRSADGAVIRGQELVDQWERRWSFTPSSPWTARVYRVCVGSALEDVCGNSITAAFDRPLRKGPNPVPEINDHSLIFRLI